jgi:16S rRNA (uracil1498-N3)-methyltransferase
MADRYFASQPIDARQVTLTGPEAHHLAHVMRSKAGEQVVLFDSTGCEYLAEVRAVRRAEVELAILERRDVDRELPINLTLGVALPKGERQKWLVEKTVELGLATLVPLVTARSVAQPSGGSLTRLRRAVVEASKQCGRNKLMTIAEPMSWSAFLADTTNIGCRMISVQGGRRARELLAIGLPEHIVAAVGPEGGFGDDEVAEAIAAGWLPLDLGSRVLRVETAAIAITATVAAFAPR